MLLANFVLLANNMSCLLPIAASEINLFSEGGVTTREFIKVPRFPKFNTYESCALWIYTTETKLDYFNTENYTNHYTLYTSADSIVLVLTETTLQWRDTDAILDFHVIKPTKSSRTSSGKWDISFDKIEYSNKKPSNFSSYHLHSCGEWLFFDSGLVLNGVKCNLNDKCTKYNLVYLELHPPDSFYLKQNPAVKPVEGKKTIDLSNLGNQAFIPPNNSTSTPYSNISQSNQTSNTTQNPFNPQNNQTPHTSSQNTQTSTTSSQSTQTSDTSSQSTQTPNSTSNQTAYTSLQNNQIPNTNIFSTATLPISMVSQINKIIPVKQVNNINIPKIRLQNIIPSLYWFTARSNELEKSDISYFRATLKSNLPLNVLQNTRFNSSISDLFGNI